MNIMKKTKRLFLTLVFICSSLILFKPFVVNQLLLRADGYFMYGMYKDALRTYKKVLALDPANTQARDWLGYTYNRMGEIDNAIRTYKKMIEIDPQNIVAYYSLGVIYAKEKEFRAAKGNFLKAISTTSKQREYTGMDYYQASLDMLAVCREKLGEIEKSNPINPTNP